MTVKYSIECWVLGPGAQVLLLQVPAKSGKHDAFWQPITGGIEEGETARQAAIREIAEETGLQISDGDLTEVAADFKVVVSPQLTINKTLYSAITTDTSVVIYLHKHQAHQWLPPAEVANALFWDSTRETWSRVSTHNRLATDDQ